MSLKDKIEYSCKDCDKHNEETDVRHLIWLTGWNTCEEEHKKQVAELKKRVDDEIFTDGKTESYWFNKGIRTALEIISEVFG